LFLIPNIFNILTQTSYNRSINFRNINRNFKFKVFEKISYISFTNILLTHYIFIHYLDYKYSKVSVIGKVFPSIVR